MGDSPAARRIKDAYLALLKESPHGGITVTEVAQRAHVNRVTFYRLFETQEAVLIDILDDFDAENRRLMVLLDASPEAAKDAVRLMLEHHRRNMPMLRTILRSNMAPVLIGRIERGTKEPLMESLRDEGPMFVSFYCAGITRVICDWILGGCKEAVNDVLAFLEKASSMTT